MELRFRSGALAALALLLPSASAQGLPSGFSESAKDLWSDVNSLLTDNPKGFFAKEACETRSKLLKELATSKAKEAGHVKSMVLQELGHCDFQEGKWKDAWRRFESSVAEIGAPSEDALLKNPHYAPMILHKEAASHLMSNEVTRAGISMRRCKTRYMRDRKDFWKQVAKQNGQGGQAIPLDRVPDMIERMRTELKSMAGDQANQAKGMVGHDNKLTILPGLLDTALNDIETVIIGDDKLLKEKHTRLKNSMQGPYAQALAMQSFIDLDNLLLGEKLLEGAKAIVKEIAEVKPDKHQTLLKRTKDGGGCKKLEKSCEALKAIPDLQTNGFGETRLLVLKAGKEQALDICETNANLGVVLALDGSVSVTIGGETREVEKGRGIVVDYCLKGSVTSKDGASVLFAQAWHPQFSSIERTTEIRERATKWGLDEDAVKAVTKTVNAEAKVAWEKASKHWAKGSAATSINDKFRDRAQVAKDAAEKAVRDKEENARNEDEERLNAVAELERKRAEKKKAQEEAEAARKERWAKVQEEEFKKDPHLRDPEVLKEKQKLAELQDERREANAKLEFDLTKELTKEISKQERKVRSTIKKAKKAWKKGKKLSGDETDAADEKDEKDDSDAEKKESEPAAKDRGAAPGGGSAADIEAELKKLDDEKAAAIKAEDFAKAGSLKKKREDLEKKLKAAKAKKGDPEKVKKLEDKLKKLEEEKAEAIKKEDFKKASEVKKQKKAAEEELKKLKDEL